MDLKDHLRDLVIANRILAHEGVVDAFGHVSIRHPERPDRFFLAAGRSPELVVADDIMEYDLDCVSISPAHDMYVERPIHGAIYQSRPDVHSVIHNHAHEVIPYSISKTTKLRPVFITAASIGKDIPVWDNRDKFRGSSMLVTTMEQGHDLARTLGQSTVTLMRGHGCAVTGKSIYDAVQTAVLLKDNAKLLSEGLRLGEVIYLADDEIEAMSHRPPGPKSRAWQYWAARCGAALL